MNKAAIVFSLLLVLFFVGGISHAASGGTYSFTPNANQTVIITTGANDIDTFSAYPLATIAGIQVIAINGTTVSASLAQNLSNEGIKDVILLGGPVVMSNASVATLETAGLNVTRIWGETAAQTALALAQYITPNGNAFDCAVFSYYNDTPGANYLYHVYASVLAAHNQCLFFPTYYSIFPTYVLSYLQDANITNVTYVGPQPLTQSQLSNLTGLTVTQITGNYSFIYNRLVQIKPKVATRFIILGEATDDWNDSMSLGALPLLNSSFAIVQNVSAQMPAIISIIKSRNISEVDVIGEPALVNQISQDLVENGIIARVSPGRGVGLNMNLLARFRKDILGANRYYKKLFNITINPAVISRAINKTFLEIQVYNNTLEQIELENGTNIPGLYNILNQSYQLTLKANASLASDNITLAVRQLTRAIAILYEGVYNSELEKEFINNSLETSMRTANEQAQDLTNQVNGYLTSINSTLQVIKKNPLLSNVSSGISAQASALSLTASQLKKCAKADNSTCVVNDENAITSGLQQLKCNVVSNGLQTNDTIVGIGPIGIPVASKNQTLTNLQVTGLTPFTVTSGVCNSSGMYISIANDHRVALDISNASVIEVSAPGILAAAASSAVGSLPTSSILSKVKTTVFPALTPSIPYNLTSESTETFSFGPSCSIPTYAYYFLVLSYSTSKHAAVSSGPAQSSVLTASGRILEKLTAI